MPTGVWHSSMLNASWNMLMSAQYFPPSVLEGESPGKNSPDWRILRLVKLSVINLAGIYLQPARSPQGPAGRLWQPNPFSWWDRCDMAYLRYSKHSRLIRSALPSLDDIDFFGSTFSSDYGVNASLMTWKRKCSAFIPPFIHLFIRSLISSSSHLYLL